MQKVQLIKEIYGTNTYSKAIDTDFSELFTQPAPIIEPVVTVEDFFEDYDELFFNIPVSGSINSHTYLVERSQQYIRGSVLDAEKQALIEEINSLRQQILDLNQTFNTVNNLT